MERRKIANKKVKKIALRSSGNFYREVLEIQKELHRMGYKTAIPHTARVMKKSGDFDISKHKTWHKDETTYKRKAFLMRLHFRKIVASDAILVVNLRKHEVEGYIGGNVLMEMAIAFFLKKPIFVLNDVSKDVSYHEEIIGMLPIFLKGDISKIK